MIKTLKNLNVRCIKEKEMCRWLTLKIELKNNLDQNQMASKYHDFIKEKGKIK